MFRRILKRNESSKRITIERSVSLGEFEFGRERGSIESKLSASDDSVPPARHVVVSLLVSHFERVIDGEEFSSSAEVGRATLEDALGGSFEEEHQRSLGVKLFDDDEGTWEEDQVVGLVDPEPAKTGIATHS